MKKITSIVISLVCFSMTLLGQKLDMSLFENMKPRSIGPAGMAGRITAIDVVQNNPDIIFAGAASGGVWKSTSGGIKWDPIFDEQTTSSIGAIAIQQSNPAVIWVGTGEGNPRNSLNSGDGIYKSLDGGKTWKKMGLELTKHIHRIIIDPTNPEIVYVGAIGSPWGAHNERGVFKTTDGGKSWKQILFSNTRSGTADLIMDPSNSNKLLAALWEHKRDPWFFKSGGEGSGLYITFDGGENWKKLTKEEGLPDGELGRMGLAWAASNTDIVYAIIEAKKNGLYKSMDGGSTWKLVNEKNEIGNRPFYYNDIFVDPKNENRIYSVFTYVNVSEDGGRSFVELMPAYNTPRGVHPDHHAWYIHPQNSNFMIDGNDGGLNITRDKGKNWQFVETLPVAQFYHIAVDNEMPYNVYGGMQDNGSWAGPAYVWKAQGIRNSYWQEISFGDGFDVLPDPRNTRFGISSSQEGYAGIYDRVTGYFEIIRPTRPQDSTKLRFNWNSGMSRDPFDPAIIYFGSQFVHKSLDNGQTWTIISPDLTTNDPEKQKQDDSGGITMDATGAENHCTLLVIEPSPIEKDVLWVGTDDGNIQLTRDKGNTWQNLSSNIPNLPKGSWITQIKASNKNKGEALLVANDYRRFNYTPYAYRTKDYGKTWQRIVDEQDVIGYTLCIVEDPEEKNLLFLGTDDGLYVSIDAGANWVKWNKSMPTTNVIDMVIHPKEHDLVIATFGRAAYVLDDIRPLREIAKSPTNEMSKMINIFTPPTGRQVAIQQPTGSRFGADALYNATNRTTQALISYFYNVPKDEKIQEVTSTKKGKSAAEETKKEEKKESKKDSILFEVINVSGEVIRTKMWAAPEKSGLYRTEWGMEEKGVGRISRDEERERKGFFEPGGEDVLPGNYMLRLTCGKEKDSTYITVTFDERLGVSHQVLKERYDFLKEVHTKGEITKKMVDRLKESNSLCNELEKEFTAIGKDQFKDQLTLIKETKDTINYFLDLFFGKEDKREGITMDQEQNVVSYYYSTTYYASSGLHSPTTNELALKQRFEKHLEKALSLCNAYYEKDWKEFRKKIESTTRSRFKEYQAIN